ncbi:MAG: DUF1294 domain-containing protein [Bacteroidales bacterium]|nr:DUF1294 domain-containing protein [Bacteroidales bacterium]
MNIYLRILILYLLAVNLLTLILYVADKRKARKGRWRIPESTLVLSAWIGGSVGALVGMYVFRHKTKHWKFRILVPLAFAAHVALAVWYFGF